MSLPDQPQLVMAWPTDLLDSPPPVAVPAGYRLRTYRPGDEPRFYEIMALAGWPGWDDERLRPWLAKILPDGWFLVVEAGSGEIVASTMSLHNYKETNPFQGEIGWVACDPAHQGQGLGAAVSAAATGRLIRAGYRHIRLYTEVFRLAALKTYLRLGYQPVAPDPATLARWRRICQALQWPYTPEAWG